MADDDPRGFYARFRTTPKMIFGTEPDRKIERQRKFIETYLTLLAEYLMRRLYLERDEAEDLAGVVVLTLVLVVTVRFVKD